MCLHVELIGGMTGCVDVLTNLPSLSRLIMREPSGALIRSVVQSTMGYMKDGDSRLPTFVGIFSHIQMMTMTIVYLVCLVSHFR